MPKVRRQPRSSTKVWTPADGAGRELRYTPIEEKPNEAKTPPQFWLYFESLPAEIRKVLNDAPNQDAFMEGYRAVLNRFPYDPATSKWTGAK